MLKISRRYFQATVPPIHRFIAASFLGFAIAIGIVFIGSPGGVGSVIAQGISFGGGDALSAEVLPPSGVTRYGVLEAAWVSSPISRENLFQIASPTIIDRSSIQADRLPVEARADIIEDLLWLEISRYRETALSELFSRLGPFNPFFASSKADTPHTTQVIISTLDNLTVVQFAQPNDARPLTVATVTSTDADFYGQSIDAIAQQWKDRLEREISQAQIIYSAKVLRQNVRQAVYTVIGLLLFTALVLYLRQHLNRRRRALKQKVADRVEQTAANTDKRETQTQPAEDSPAENSPAENSPAESHLAEGNSSHPAKGQPAKGRSAKGHPAKDNPTVAKAFTQGLTRDLTKNLTKDLTKEFRRGQLTQLFEQQLSLSKRINFYQFLQWILLWITVLAWYGSIYILTTQLPTLMQWRERVLTGPLVLLAIWFLTSVAIRISTTLIQRSINVWKESPRLTFGNVRRQVLLSQTISGALQGLAISILVSLGILLTLIQFGLPVSSLLTGGALIGVALSFGAQNLIRDVVNGCLILIEDQFAVGDVISVNGEAGIVESLNLRLTQLRNAEGELISVPNSNISLVKNLTSSWSRVNLPIELAYNTDVDQAIVLVEKVARSLSDDEAWRSSILEDPEVLGVDSFGQNSMTLLLQIRTEPLQQWAVARELRRRLKHAFDKAGISIPFPQQLVQFENTLPIAKKAENNTQQITHHYDDHTDKNSNTHAS
ncbi:MAG: mechanosensitive ion channel family protein [Cyanobacteria bacterium J06607_10]